MHYQWVPGHIGIEGNEEANSLANDLRNESTINMQLQHEIEPASLKTFLWQHERNKFHARALTDPHHHSGYRILNAGIKKSNFKLRQYVPRALQCLYSRWRLGRVDSCGSYARHLGYLEDDNFVCRFCNQAKESTFHLCSTCFVLEPYRQAHNISSETLMNDSPQNIFAIAAFDNHITNTFPYAQEPPLQQPLDIIFRTEKRRITPDFFTSSPPKEPPAKRIRSTGGVRKQLIIPLSPKSTNNKQQKQQ